MNVIDYGQYLPASWPTAYRAVASVTMSDTGDPNRAQPDMIGMLREWQLDERARAADEQAQRDRLRAWVVDQTGPGGVPVLDWMEDDA